MAQTETGRQVHAFYQRLHFNEGGDRDELLALVRSGKLCEQQFLPVFLRELDGLDQNGPFRILEVGCGVGWLAASMASRFSRAAVTAVDFSDRALAAAENLTAEAGCDVVLHQLDILDNDAMAALGAFDAVVSIGVLHHTGDFAVALANSLARVAPGGSALLGLYHAHRRRPFLDHFRELQQGGADEDALRRAYTRLDGRIKDAVQAESWFQDQVLHPHESQHTVAELLMLAGDRFRHAENSITGGRLPDGALLARMEERQRLTGEQNLAAGHYDPGFFLTHFSRKTEPC